MFAIRITAGSSSPIYQQIVAQVRHAIATGAVKEGELLPSVRGLAEELLINPNTVAKAYGELSREGLVEGVPGKGLAVVRREGTGLSREERMQRIGPLVERLVMEAVGLELSAEEVREAVERAWRAGTGDGGKEPRLPTDAHGLQEARDDIPSEAAGL